MLTDLEGIKRCLQAGCKLRNRGQGWKLEAGGGFVLKRWQMPETLEVPADLVALLSAQVCIKTDLRVVGSAEWVGDRVGVAL